MSILRLWWRLTYLSVPNDTCVMFHSFADGFSRGSSLSLLLDLSEFLSVRNSWGPIYSIEDDDSHSSCQMTCSSHGISGLSSE